MMCFLSHAALESGEQQASEFDSAVQMMTLHSAKGEFPYVFIISMEENLFLANLSTEDPLNSKKNDVFAMWECRALCNSCLCWARKTPHLW